MTTLLIIIHVIVCFFLIAIVLLQHGKGADAGAAFGGGSSQTLFGSEGPLPLLNKITTFSAIVFMGTSVTLAYLSAHKSTGSVMSQLPAKEAAAPEKKEAPVTIPMPTEQPAAKTEAEPAVPAQKAAEPTAAVPQQEQSAPPAVEKAVVPVEQKAAPAAAGQQTQAAAPAASEQKKQETAPAEKKAE
ncbi:preprotein translocase subunit SecG [Candidatus Electronema sp. JC]|uniref:preprotein translocase subunit SecG n=1 Tax=Candidatus Electronema sp. JC TaxID=3401570 RepID=UPI003B42CB38